MLVLFPDVIEYIFIQIVCLSLVFSQMYSLSRAELIVFDTFQLRADISNYSFESKVRHIKMRLYS